MWLAHGLTLVRIPLAIALWWVWGDPLGSAVIIALAALSDIADGRVARRAKRRGASGPDIGGWLDPAVDKVFVAIVLAVIWVHAPLDHLVHPFVVIALIGARELVLVPLVAIYLARYPEHPALHADRFGKLATIAQFVALCVIAVAPSHAVPAAVVAGTLGMVAAGHYIAAAAQAVALDAARNAESGRDTPRS